MFFRLCQPLQDAWAYKTMRKYAPDVYQKEVSELFAMWQKLYPDILQDKDAEMRRQILGMWAILYENPANNVEIILQTDEQNKVDWDSYIATLKKLIRKEPEAKLFLELPIASHAPYRVRIATDRDGFRHYDIRLEDMH